MKCKTCGKEIPESLAAEVKEKGEALHDCGQKFRLSCGRVCHAPAAKK